jgi:hypothetical protein
MWVLRFTINKEEIETMCAIWYNLSDSNCYTLFHFIGGENS